MNTAAIEAEFQFMGQLPPPACHPARAAAQYPMVKGRCPACGYRSLFLAAGGYVTCSVIPCPDPGAASDLLDSEESSDG